MILMAINRKMVLLCLLMFLILFFAADEFKSNKDFDFHFNLSKIPAKCPEPYTKEMCDVYPYLTHVISSPFAFDDFIFKVYTIFLITILIPFILYWVTKKFSSTVFYFTTTFFGLNTISILANVYAVIVFLLFIKTKNHFTRFGMLIISLLVHNLLPFLLVAYWILETGLPLLKKWKNFFPMAVPTCCFNATNFFALNWFYFIITICLSQTPQIVFKSLKRFWVGKDLHYAILIIVSLVYSTDIFRAFWVAQICFVLVAVKGRFDRHDLEYSLAWIGFNLIAFVIQPDKSVADLGVVVFAKLYYLFMIYMTVRFWIKKRFKG